MKRLRHARRGFPQHTEYTGLESLRILILQPHRREFRARISVPWKPYPLCGARCFPPLPFPSVSSCLDDMRSMCARETGTCRGQAFCRLTLRRRISCPEIRRVTPASTWYKRRTRPKSGTVSTILRHPEAYRGHHHGLIWPTNVSRTSLSRKATVGTFTVSRRRG